MDTESVSNLNQNLFYSTYYSEAILYIEVCALLKEKCFQNVSNNGGLLHPALII